MQLLKGTHMKINYKKGIPIGSFCYQMLEVKYHQNGIPYFKTKNCRYLRYRKGGKRSFHESPTKHYSYCKLLKHSTTDSCKECGVNIFPFFYCEHCYELFESDILAPSIANSERMVECLNCRKMIKEYQEL